MTEPTRPASPDALDTLLAGQPVMAILRHLGPEDTVRLATTAWDLGIQLVEVPIQTPDAVPSLEAALAAGRERGRGVGAGTVISVEQVELAARLGVTFTVAPGLDTDVVAASQQHSVPHVPGVATASEIQSALRAGCRWLKAFPATVLGTSWFGAMVKGPFPGLKLVATGGIDASNARSYLDAGASLVAVGSALEDPEQLPRLAELIRPA
ncbi:bifunctional 4-hydroxy-2-oxoglutarate aldolase/2-dehydro-3-deoxy-phosphogluconate aldolase [Desertihabitans aurantiacus]|uniref:bifunctional 4-hydroxy-2-oxoglutarate aldolase/2-dehydro-3-deoxy-phosphogluconate aldolase n=1 Tax=Desertihabitans aurantiacus TaxID=2282477 RepID=UPI000DF800C3|nr:bifunctional 4-hydroxy-2-oxoglutarate aldolase/2-dehydro-3-deoxy-phosphogluconate aldolase [Desertihabitans aurantiacus]